MPTRRRQTSNFWAITKQRLTIEMTRPRISRRRISKSRSRYWQTQALTTALRYTAQCCGGRKEAWLPSQSRGVAGVHHAEDGYQERKRQADVQCDGDSHVSGDHHYAVGASVHAWSATDHCRRRYVPSVDRKAGLDEMGFVASQHLDSVRDKFHLRDFSHIGEELSDMGKQLLGAL
jgi:hypothetical protein